MGRSFYKGRWYWASQDGLGRLLQDQHDQHQLKLLLKNSESPWKAVAWRTPIPAARNLLLHRSGEGN